MISFYPLREFVFPVTADCICPDTLKDKSAKEVQELPIWEGNRQKRLGQLFRIETHGKEALKVTVRGDVSKLRRIGAKMTEGEIIINGDAGAHLGEEMKGGKITVQGNTGSWVGSMMGGGEIRIRGNACDYVGAPYRGRGEGMRGGRIIIHGNAGSEAGAFMKDGIIKVYGNAGQFAGFRMHNGTVYVKKDCADRTGACMTDGRIIVGGFIASVLPTFTIEGLRSKVKTEEAELVDEPMYLFVGDRTEGGKGKLYVCRNKNPHLSRHERLL